MINDKQTKYLAVNGIILATIGVGMSYYKTEGPVGPAEIAGPAGTTSVYVMVKARISRQARLSRFGEKYG
ncbi:MAG: hypothetical protein ACERKS_00030 [Candidatus Bathyarchaeota archaeon]